MPKKTGLGKGLDALFSASLVEAFSFVATALIPAISGLSLINTLFLSSIFKE